MFWLRNKKNNFQLHTWGGGGGGGEGGPESSLNVWYSRNDKSYEL